MGLSSGALTPLAGKQAGGVGWAPSGLDSRVEWSLFPLSAAPGSVHALLKPGSWELPLCGQSHLAQIL